MGKKTARLMSIDFESKPFYGGDDKYVKKKNIQVVWLQLFITKKYLKEKYHADFYK